MVNQKSQPALKLLRHKMQNAGYTEGFLRLADTNHYSFPQENRPQTKSIKHPETTT